MTDEQIIELARSMPIRPHGVGSRSADLIPFVRAILAQAAPLAPQQAGDGLTVTDDMVTRFLEWRLPNDFAPDCGVSFKPPMHEGKPLSWPIGTNLLHAGQARQMLEHVLADPRQPGEMGAGVPISELVAEVEAEPGGKERLDAARERLRQHVAASAQQSDMSQDDTSRDCPHDTCDQAACKCVAASAQQDEREATLTRISELLTVMLMSACCYIDSDDTVTGYRIKTGAIHRIIGLLASAGHSVSIPSNMPIENKS